MERGLNKAEDTFYLREGMGCIEGYGGELKAGRKLLEGLSNKVTKLKFSFRKMSEVLKYLNEQNFHFQRLFIEREVGAGIGMGNTCNFMADSCQCMIKPTAML